jgi:hypothetical protein
VKRPPKVNTIVKRLRIDRKDISFLKYILEATDGLAVLSTVDAYQGLVALTIAPGCAADVETILADLKRTMMIEEIPDNASAG